ncbi:hypothetical protein NliqN6_3382 [Naganishia liquefaciens]|uniref:Glycosyltransferase 2-like domain-containing protein n=1 Tax=Naganishia liquefaciens TaxID=104408 RepID=A0A8H3YEU6_9TREE|nr:hypothetical protein NliqN6_3382 [Naganishia liquefaciens]
MSNAETDLRKAGDVKVAVVCPILIADPQEDIKAVRRVYLSLSKQIRKPDQIIFVDDGSPVPIGPNDLALVKDHKAAPTAIVQLKYNRGPPAARNAGINFAIISLGADPGRTIVFLLDIDCVAPADWIQRGCDAVLVHRPHISNQSMPSEPLIIAGISSGINPASIYT